MSERSDYYIYIVYAADDVPCYVGKGRANRYRQHQRRVAGNPDYAAIYNGAGKQLRVEKIQTGLSNSEAFSAEIEMIAKLGRADKGLGPLVNHTDGGGSIRGPIFSAEARAAMTSRLVAYNRARKGEKRDPEIVAKIRAGNIGKKRTPEQNQRMGEARRGKPSPKRGKPSGRKGIPHSPEHAQKVREALIRTAEQRRLAISAALKGRPKNALEIASKPCMQKGVPKSEEQKAKMAAARVGRKLSEAHKAAIGAAHRGKKHARQKTAQE